MCPTTSANKFSASHKNEIMRSLWGQFLWTFYGKGKICSMKRVKYSPTNRQRCTCTILTLWVSLSMGEKWEKEK